MLGQGENCLKESRSEGGAFQGWLDKTGISSFARPQGRRALWEASDFWDRQRATANTLQCTRKGPHTRWSKGMSSSERRRKECSKTYLVYRRPWKPKFRMAVSLPLAVLSRSWRILCSVSSRLHSRPEDLGLWAPFCQLVTPVPASLPVFPVTPNATMQLGICTTLLSFQVKGRWRKDRAWDFMSHLIFKF